MTTEDESPSERLGAQLLSGRLGRVLVWGTVTLICGAVAAEVRGLSDEARAQGEILACGRPGCALRTLGGAMEWIGIGCTDNEGFQATDYLFVFASTGKPGGFTYSRISCPRRYFLFGAHRCRRVHPDVPWEHPLGYEPGDDFLIYP